MLCSRLAMFGSYRYLLAHMVLLSHLWPGLGLWPGPYAVFAFFVLSGYLMSQVLEETYPADLRGVARFLLNRALRIYPPYWLALAAGLVTVAFIPEDAARVDVWPIWPRGWDQWARNVFIFGLNEEPFRVVLPAWSLDIELMFYLVMATGMTRSRAACRVWLAASLAWTLYLVSAEASFPDRYASLLSASLPFACGANLYHARDRLRRGLHWRGHVLLAVGLFVANAALPRFIGYDPFELGFYLSLLLTAYGVGALVARGERLLPVWFSRLDRRLGELSYPIFLCHLPVLPWVVWAGLAPAKGGAMLLFGTLLANVVGFVIHLVAELPLVHLRGRVRGDVPRRHI